MNKGLNIVFASILLIILGIFSYLIVISCSEQLVILSPLPLIGYLMIGYGYCKDVDSSQWPKLYILSHFLFKIFCYPAFYIVRSFLSLKNEDKV